MTRRDLMRGAVAAAFPIGRVAAAEPVGPVMAKLSAHLSEAQGRALPPEVIEKAKHHILDTFAAIISGAQLQPGKVAIAFARARGGEKVATVAGSNVVCGAIDAAFANGMLAHSDETDDYATPQGLPFFQRLSSSSVPERSVIGKLVRTACKGVWIVEESNRMCAPEVQTLGTRLQVRFAIL